MDLGYLKLKIDIKSEYEEYRKKYNFKKKETKKEEVKNIFDGFKDFFKTDGSFKFKENEHSVTAEYKDHGITIDIDVYRIIDAEGFTIEGTIKTYEKECYEFSAEVISNKDVPLHTAGADEQERMIQDTRYFKDFLDGDIVYTYQYRLKSREEVYSTVPEMLQSL